MLKWSLCKIMKNFYYLGIDVSKKKLDLSLRHHNSVVMETTVSNDCVRIISVIEEWLEYLGIDSEDLIICAEHTGQYTYCLCRACHSRGWRLWLENPMQIKSVLRMSRGKNDRVDARRIAEYADRYADKMRLYRLPIHEIEELRSLNSLRDLVKSHCSTYVKQLGDQKDFKSPDIFKMQSRLSRRLIKAFERCLEEIETRMRRIINDSDCLRHQMMLLQSVEGVGEVTAWKTIVATEAFTKFQNARQFNCYIGTAPFAYTSGTSLNSKARVSHKANKEMKAILHMAAVSITSRKTGELKAYYDRKVAQGKNRMSVINALRAKIVARMFAVIKNDRIYQPILSK